MSKNKSDKCLSCEMMMSCLDSITKGEDGKCTYFEGLKRTITPGKEKNDG